VPESRVLAEPLRGGRTTLGVVKLGETVRRPATPNSIFVRNLLMHLERSGFAGAPRHLGVDEDSRDVFSYLPGEVPSELGRHKDHVLQAAARLIRGFTMRLPPWWIRTLRRAPDFEVVCHNYLSPCNAVFRTGIPVALIDFDGLARVRAPSIWDTPHGYGWIWEIRTGLRLIKSGGCASFSPHMVRNRRRLRSLSRRFVARPFSYQQVFGRAADISEWLGMPRMDAQSPSITCGMARAAGNCNDPAFSSEGACDEHSGDIAVSVKRRSQTHRHTT